MSHDPGKARASAASTASPSSAPAGSEAAVRVRVPASSANLGPGFDAFGLALGVWDVYEARVEGPPGLRIVVDGDGQGVPTDERHLVYASMCRAFAEAGHTPPPGLTLHCANTIRQGRGMGSSAAAIVAGVALAHALLASIDGVSDDADLLDLDAVNDLAGRLEGHPDNASASVYGGMTVSWADDTPTASPGSTTAQSWCRSARVPVHPDVEPVVFVPQVQLATATARAVLPGHVPHVEAARNSARAGLLVLAASARPDLLLPATREWLHQEQRRSSLGGAMELVDALRAAGHAAVVSGAGPSVLVLATSASGAPEALAPRGWAVLRPGVPDQGVQASVLH